MSAQRLGEDELDVKKRRGERVARLRQIPLHMQSGREKVRHQDHAGGTVLDTLVAGVGDAGLGQLQKRRDNEGMASRAQFGGDVIQVGVRLGMSAAMGDQE